MSKQRLCIVKCVSETQVSRKEITFALVCICAWCFFTQIKGHQSYDTDFTISAKVGLFLVVLIFFQDTFTCKLLHTKLVSKRLPRCQSVRVYPMVFCFYILYYFRKAVRLFE